jgi:hypothetical protein
MFFLYLIIKHSVKYKTLKLKLVLEIHYKGQSKMIVKL